jgi:molecular chaperone GrpE (heat shock protein)
MDKKRTTKNVNPAIDEKSLLENQLKKALADYANLERDLDKRIEARSIQMKIQIAHTLMNVLDDVSLAMEAGSKLQLADDAKAWMAGVSATMADIEKAIREFGIVKMEVSVGQEYNSSMHEAIGTVSEGEKGKIHQVVQPGYLLAEIVVRPARVIVQQGK